MPYNRSAMPAQETMSEDSDMPKGPQGPGAEQESTAEVPVSMFKGQSLKPGDVFEFKVVGVNQESGSVTVAYNTGEEEGYGGSDDMAAEFDKPQAQQPKGML